MSLWSRLFGKPRDPAELEALMAELTTAMRPWLRAATRLVPEPWDDPGGGVGSRAGGMPYAEPGETWPRCGSCGVALDFIAQVDLRECPNRPTEAFDLFTFYYCWECFPWGDPTGEDQGQWALRTHSQASPERRKPLSPPGRDGQVTRPARLVPSSHPVLPSGEELDARDLPLAQRLEALPEFPDIVEALEERVLGRPITADGPTLVGGYPAWIQGEEAPRNAVGRRFELLAQLDSEPVPGWMWGDAGCVYLLFDPDDPHDVRLVLQSH